MYFWYVMVVVSSLLENRAGVPFSRQWTLRVSEALKVRISQDAPLIVQQMSAVVLESQPESLLQEPNQGISLTNSRKPLSDTYAGGDQNTQKGQATVDTTSGSTPLAQAEGLGGDFNYSSLRFTLSDLLQDLETGYNTKSRIILDPDEPLCQPRVPFCVIISLEGVSGTRAILRVFSKLVGIGVFAFGTATFASATLITFSVAVTVLAGVLGAGVFGRVVAMWIVAEMMKTEPVLHHVVRGRAEVAEYMRAILSKPGLTCEIMGHVVVNGRCVKRFN